MALVVSLALAVGAVLINDLADNTIRDRTRYRVPCVSRSQAPCPRSAG